MAASLMTPRHVLCKMSPRPSRSRSFAWHGVPMRLLLVLACLMVWGGARHALALEALEPAAASPQPVEPAYETPPETAMDFSQTIEPLPGPAAGPVLLDPPYEGWQDDFYEQPWRSGGRVATGFPEQWDDLWAQRPW